MTQLAPSVLLYSQAVALLQELKEDLADGKHKTPQEVSEKIRDLISRYAASAGKPLSQFEPYVKGEPTNSVKYNRFLASVENDVNLMQDQIDLLKASTVFMYNYARTEMLLANTLNAQALNKLKTLQLYSNAADANMVIFGDFFTNQEFMDTGLVPVEQRIMLAGSGNVTLGRESVDQSLMDDVNVRILPTSNGFLGNNHEIEDPNAATTNNITGTKQYVFLAETDRRADLAAVLDGDSSTWFEFEHVKLTDADRSAAQNFNFSYRNSDSTDSTDHANDLIDWSRGPQDDVLRLDLEFDLKEVKDLNSISYTPYGMKNNAAPPVKVTSVKTSDTGTSWSEVTPTNVWIGTEANLQISNAAETTTVGTAIWNFETRPTRYIRMSIVQPKSFIANIGHLYYEQTVSGSYTYRDPASISTTSTDPETVRHNYSTMEEMYQVRDSIEAGWPSGPSMYVSFNGDGVYWIDYHDVPPMVTASYSYTQRAAGPNPPITDPDLYYDDSQPIAGGYTKKREYFTGERWAIGVRDCNFQSRIYKPFSMLISKPFRVSGLVDRIALEADLAIPLDYPEDNLWVRFFVSPDDGSNWFPISRIQDNAFGVPEIIAFNDPIPEEFREQGVTYHTVNNTVNSLRVKIELYRPEGDVSSSPVIHWYKLKIRKR